MLHGHFLDNYSQHDSPIHRLPATAKLMAMLAIVLSVLTVPVSHALFFIAVAFVHARHRRGQPDPGPFSHQAAV